MRSTAGSPSPTWYGIEKLMKGLDISFSEPSAQWWQDRRAEGYEAMVQNLWTGGFASNEGIKAVAANNLRRARLRLRYPSQDGGRSDLHAGEGQDQDGSGRDNDDHMRSAQTADSGLAPLFGIVVLPTLRGGG